MPAGGAKEKQAKLNFIPSSQPDNQRNSQLNNNNASDTNENAGDEIISNRQKRNRAEFEQPDDTRDHLPIPEIRATESDSSLFSSDSTNTIVVGRQENISVRPIESASINDLNNNQNGNSNVTDERHKPRIIRLE